MNITPEAESTDTSINLPGNVRFDKELVGKINTLKVKRGDKYVPRTRHVTKDGRARYTNRLFLESSPYLLQHAHNPVNWYPWGEEAFSSARKQNKPVLLSIGYSTCHWCHVMEEESFEDEEIAAFINTHYIPIKVDREERPEIDAIYMEAVQTLTGGGGWPLNVWLTHDMKPFYGGTYFPARDGDRGVNTGFLTILRSISASYAVKKEVIEKTGRTLTESINKAAANHTGGVLPGVEKVQEGIQYYQSRFDSIYGGLAGQIKFPSSLPARLLFRYYHQTGDETVLSMALHSLRKMGESGMYDHAGGGFHRYATDEKWLVPHFEKMLYDNALLAVAYLEAWQLTGLSFYKDITCDILDYVSREMTAFEGGFYSAQDADSMTPSGHMEEGYFFTWTREEIRGVLGDKNADIVEIYYRMNRAPNFEGRYILHHSGNDFENIAEKTGLSAGEVEDVIGKGKKALYKERQKRTAPLRDDKILTAWNGLMISAFAKAGFSFNRPDYIQKAMNAAGFVLTHACKEGRLFRSFNDGHARHNACLSDYAFFISGLLDLYESTFEIAWMKHAVQLDRVLADYFEDKENGGFFMTSHDHETLISRGKPADDGAIPSGNAIAVMNLLRLSLFTGNAGYSERAVSAMKAFLGTGTKHAAQVPEMLMALDFYLDRPLEIAIVTPENKPEESEGFLDILRKRYTPNKVLAVTAEGDFKKKNDEVISLFKGRKTIEGKGTVYVCEKGACKLPVNTIEGFLQRIGEK